MISLPNPLHLMGDMMSVMADTASKASPHLARLKAGILRAQTDSVEEKEFGSTSSTVVPNSPLAQSSPMFNLSLSVDQENNYNNNNNNHNSSTVRLGGGCEKRIASYHSLHLLKRIFLGSSDGTLSRSSLDKTPVPSPQSSLDQTHPPSFQPMDVECVIVEDCSDSLTHPPSNGTPTHPWSTGVSCSTGSVVMGGRGARRHAWLMQEENNRRRLSSAVEEVEEDIGSAESSAVSIREVSSSEYSLLSGDPKHLISVPANTYLLSPGDVKHKFHKQGSEEGRSLFRESSTTSSEDLGRQQASQGGGEGRSLAQLSSPCGRGRLAHYSMGLSLDSSHSEDSVEPRPILRSGSIGRQIWTLRSALENESVDESAGEDQYMPSPCSPQNNSTLGFDHLSLDPSGSMTSSFQITHLRKFSRYDSRETSVESNVTTDDSSDLSELYYNRGNTESDSYSDSGAKLRLGKYLGAVDQTGGGGWPPRSSPPSSELNTGGSSGNSLSRGAHMGAGELEGGEAGERLKDQDSLELDALKERIVSETEKMSCSKHRSMTRRRRDFIKCRSEQVVDSFEEEQETCPTGGPMNAATSRHWGTHMRHLGRYSLTKRDYSIDQKTDEIFKDFLKATEGQSLQRFYTRPGCRRARSTVCTSYHQDSIEETDDLVDDNDEEDEEETAVSRKTSSSQPLSFVPKRESSIDEERIQQWSPRLAPIESQDSLAS